MFDRLYNWVSGRTAKRARQRRAVRDFDRAIRARYDAAQTTRENERHWSQADSWSADWATNPSTRQTLVKRARYERDNNCYASGIVGTVVNDMIGTGPRLQIQEPDQMVKRAVEARWKSWLAAVRYTEKLRTYASSYIVDGEGISVFFTNPKVDDPVDLDFRLIETEQLTTPGVVPWDVNAVDGIEFDFYGNPKWYSVLRYHPGDVGFQWNACDSIPPAFLTHWFCQIRPGQSRGIPHLTQALPLFAQLRRYTLAVLTAAEIAANHAAVLETDMLPGEEDSDEDTDAFKEFAMTRGLLTALPAGVKMSQFDAKQPVTTYEMFKRELLNEIARCLCVPYNIAAGNSMNYNYSSGRLDHLIYYSMIRARRESLQSVKIEPTFKLWYQMGKNIPGYFPEQAPKMIPLRSWHWDPRPSIDPQKDAQADTERLNNGTATLHGIYAENGGDFDQAMAERGQEFRVIRQQQITLSALTGGYSNAA